MSHDRDYYRHHRRYIERIIEQSPDVRQMFGPVAEASRKLRTMDNRDLTAQLYRVAEEYPETALLMDEVCSRLSAVGEIAMEAEPGVN